MKKAANGAESTETAAAAEPGIPEPVSEENAEPAATESAEPEKDEKTAEKTEHQNTETQES